MITEGEFPVKRVDCRGKWGLAPWRQPLPREEKRYRHGACPLFPRALPAEPFEKGKRHRRQEHCFAERSLFEATEPVPVFVFCVLWVEWDGNDGKFRCWCLASEVGLVHNDCLSDPMSIMQLRSSLRWEDKQ